MTTHSPSNNEPQEPKKAQTPDDSQKALTDIGKNLSEDIKKSTDKAKESVKQKTEQAKEAAQSGKEKVHEAQVNTKRKGHDFGKWIGGFCAGIVVGIIAALLLIQIGHSAKNLPEAEEVTTLDITTVQQIVEPASSLISTTYNYTDIIEYKNSKQVGGVDVPLTENHFLITYGGVIQLGINSLNDITYDIDNTNKTITVGLPEIVIISNSLDQDSFKKYEVKNSILNETTMEETIDMEREFKDAQGNKVMSDEDVMLEAEENLKTTISLFLTAADETSEYEIIFK